MIIGSTAIVLWAAGLLLYLLFLSFVRNRDRAKTVSGSINELESQFEDFKIEGINVDDLELELDKIKKEIKRLG